jgi:hypothetical protein
MMREMMKLIVAALLALILVAPCAIAGGTKKKEKKGKCVELFNGKDTSGWRHIGPGEFVVEDGALVSKGGMGMLYYEEKKFKDFTLEIEWKANHKCNNSGIFVRFPEKSDDPMYSVNNGYEIQICDCDKQGLMYETGAIYSFHPATKIASKNAGEWNLYQITVVGQHYTVRLNGEKVNEFDGERGLDGYIGLQNHDPISRVSFRRVRVKEGK